MSKEDPVSFKKKVHSVLQILVGFNNVMYPPFFLSTITIVSVP